MEVIQRIIDCYFQAIQLANENMSAFYHQTSYVDNPANWTKCYRVGQATMKGNCSQAKINTIVCDISEWWGFERKAGEITPANNEWEESNTLG